MATLLLYYSRSGSTRAIAEQIAKRHKDIVIEEVKEAKRRSKLGAYFPGMTQAIKGIPTPIEKIQADVAYYDSVILMAPIWGSFPAPPFYSMLERIPSGKRVSVYLNSGSGNVSLCRPKIEALLSVRGLTLEEWRSYCNGEML